MKRLVGILATSMLFAAACSSDDDETPAGSGTAPASSSASTVPVSASEDLGAGLFDHDDPEPVPAGNPTPLPATGGDVDLGGVRVKVPAGLAVEVRTGTVPERIGSERFGTPVAVEHAEPLPGPVEVRWDISRVPAAERERIGLAAWDETLRAWRLDTTSPFTIEGDELVASFTSFSWRDWIANAAPNISQEVGELSGTRRDPPKCEREREGLSQWVRGTVDPDAGTSAAAIGVCFEPDRDEIVTVRVTNNRPFTQLLEMTGGGQQWAWTWPGGSDPTLSGAVALAARQFVDSPTRHLLPPLSETAVGIGRPSGGGQHNVAATARVTTATVFADAAAFLLGQIDVGGLENPLLNLVVQVLFECGGSQLLDQPTLQETARVVVEALVSCAKLMFDPTSEAGILFENGVRALLDAAPSDARRAVIVKGHRGALHLAQAARLFSVGKLLFYLTDQAQNAYVGNLTLSVRGDGRPGALGGWTATCTDVRADINLVYRDIALREPFTDTSRELRDFAELAPTAATAVAPLDACPVDHRQAVADQMPSNWGDAEAGRIVAEIIRSRLPAAHPSAGPGGLPASGCDDVRAVAQEIGTRMAAQFSGYDTWVDSPEFWTIAEREMLDLSLRCGHARGLEVISETNIVGPTNRALTGLLESAPETYDGPAGLPDPVEVALQTVRAYLKGDPTITTVALPDAVEFLESSGIRERLRDPTASVDTDVSQRYGGDPSGCWLEGDITLNCQIDIAGYSESVESNALYNVSIYVQRSIPGRVSGERIYVAVDADVWHERG